MKRGEVLKLGEVSLQDFEAEYAASLEQAQKMNKGVAGEVQKMKNRHGREVFLGYKKGRVRVDEFQRGMGECDLRVFSETSEWRETLKISKLRLPKRGRQCGYDSEFPRHFYSRRLLPRHCSGQLTWISAPERESLDRSLGKPRLGNPFSRCTADSLRGSADFSATCDWPKFQKFRARNSKHSNFSHDLLGGLLRGFGRKFRLRRDPNSRASRSNTCLCPQNFSRKNGWF